MKKTVSLFVCVAAVALATPAMAKPNCDYLYVGKKVPVEWYTKSFFGKTTYSTKYGIIIGVSAENNSATVKMLHNDEIINKSCYGFLEDWEKNDN